MTCIVATGNVGIICIFWGQTDVSLDGAMPLWLHRERIAMKFLITTAATVAAMTATHAAAADFVVSFDTTSTLFGGPAQTIRGKISTSDTPTTISGQLAFAITNISGTINDVAITGLFDTGSPYYFFTTGPTFLDGSGVRFNAGAATNIAFFHQDGVAADTYRVNGNGTISAFGPASATPLAAAAVPEPASWAILVLGMGAVGVVMRRQKVTTRVSYAA